LGGKANVAPATVGGYLEGFDRERQLHGLRKKLTGSGAQQSREGHHPAGVENGRLCRKKDHRGT